MEFDVIYIGEIDRLLDAIYYFSEERVYDYGDSHRWEPEYGYSLLPIAEVRINEPYIELWDRSYNKPTTLKIDTIRVDVDRTRLIISCKDEDWPRLKKWWDLLYEHLVIKGIIEEDQAIHLEIDSEKLDDNKITRNSWEGFEHAQNHSIIANKGLKGGRPSNPDDDWAYEQVVVLNRPNMDVYPEWKVRIGNRVNDLINPMESFKKAIQNRRKKWGNKGEKRE